jgi:transcription elongation factor GreA
MKKLQNPLMQRIPFTKKGFSELLEEKNKYEKLRPEAVEHLRKAREMGDLSENGYYKASRQQLSFIDGKLRHIERLRRLAVIVEPQQNGVIQLGSTVNLIVQGKKVVFQIVGGYESDPKEGTISDRSPLGKALIGKKVGDIITVSTPRGSVIYEVVSITI